MNTVVIYIYIHHSLHYVYLYYTQTCARVCHRFFFTTLMHIHVLYLFTHPQRNGHFISRLYAYVFIIIPMTLFPMAEITVLVPQTATTANIDCGSLVRCLATVVVHRAQSFKWQLDSSSPHVLYN